MSAFQAYCNNFSKTIFHKCSIVLPNVHPDSYRDVRWRLQRHRQQPQLNRCNSLCNITRIKKPRPFSLGFLFLSRWYIQRNVPFHHVVSVGSFPCKEEYKSCSFLQQIVIDFIGCIAGLVIIFMYAIKEK